MIDTHITLPGSRDFSLPSSTCSKCGNEKTGSDGVYMGQKFICGMCWRRHATRGYGAVGSRSKK